MNAISNWFTKTSTTRITLIAFLLFLIFSGLTLPAESRKAEAYSGGTGSADTSLFYSSQDLTNMAEKYGELGRQAYIKARWSFDLAFPFIYGFFLITSISWVMGRLLPTGSRLHLFNLVPLAAVLFDFLENISVSLVMARYPIPCPPGLLLAPVFTPIKWLLVGSSFLILFIASLLLVYKRLRKTK